MELNPGNHVIAKVMESFTIKAMVIQKPSIYDDKSFYYCKCTEKKGRYREGEVFVAHEQDLIKYRRFSMPEYIKKARLLKFQ